jgi:amidophosphoribosyltransferase
LKTIRRKAEMYPDKLHEECGVFGIFSNGKEDVASITYYGLYALQHRGQESAGIVVSDEKELLCHKGMGLVSEIFSEDDLKKLKGKNAIGHVRYSTAGSSNINNAQPILVKCKIGSVAIAHNGNLVNAEILKELLEETGTVFQTTTDSEVILNLIARSSRHGLEKAITDTVFAIKGSYAIVMLTEDKLIGIRDPNGIRPLCIGKLKDDYILCSESCAIDAVGGEFIRDVEPAEIVMIDKEGIRSFKNSEKIKSETCAFEYIYFARPDSIIDGIDVYQARRRCGHVLYEESPISCDLITGVPDSGVAAAIGYSEASGIPYGMTLIKNKYIGRTFIAPSQKQRQNSVNVKLNALKSNIKGKRILMIDDSIVRGTTSKKLVTLLRNAGAKEVHMMIASPPVKFPCYFGIDTPERGQLIGANMSIEEIRKEIGADTLAYLSVPGLLRALDHGNTFCLGCFNGIYPVEAPIEKSKLYLEDKK